MKTKHVPLSAIETTHEELERKENVVETVSNIGYESIDPSNAPACLSWSNLIVSTNPRGKEPKYLLKCVSGQITGGLWAIMGSSGSGKTTFLSALAKRLDSSRMFVTGDIRLNGRAYSKHELKSMSGYVMQDDMVNANFTVEETLSYTAELRMPASSTQEERTKRIAEVMKLMGIHHCRNVMVGDTRNKGISGGERKRLCIAMELLMKPALLFLDEPTSGTTLRIFSVYFILIFCAKSVCCQVWTLQLRCQCWRLCTDCVHGASAPW